MARTRAAEGEHGRRHPRRDGDQACDLGRRRSEPATGRVTCTWRRNVTEFAA